MVRVTDLHRDFYTIKDLSTIRSCQSTHVFPQMGMKVPTRLEEKTELTKAS